MKLKDFKNEIARENGWPDFESMERGSINYPFRQSDEAAERYAQHRYLVGQKTGANQQFRATVGQIERVLSPRCGVHFEIDYNEARKICKQYREMSKGEIMNLLQFIKFKCTFVNGVPLLRPDNYWSQRNKLFELFATEYTLIFPEGVDGKFWPRSQINIAYRYAELGEGGSDEWTYCWHKEYLEKAENPGYQVQKIFTLKKQYQ
jgi:hypothetical protein